MANLGQLINKLQLALAMKNVEVTVNKKQFYSIMYEKVVTVYKIEERDPVSGKKSLLIKTYKQADAVKALAARWEEVREDGDA